MSWLSTFRPLAFSRLLFLTLLISVVCSEGISFDIDDPPSYAKSWTSIPELLKFANLLSSEQQWNSTIYEFRQALLSTSKLQAALHQDIAKSFKRTPTSSDAKVELERLAQGRVTIAIEVGACASSITSNKTLHLRADLDSESCDADNERSYPILLDHISTYDQQSLKFCHRVCKSAAVQLAEDWSERSKKLRSSRIALFAPTSLNECAATTLAHMQFFGQDGNITTLDNRPWWTDDISALAVGDDPVMCAPGAHTVARFLQGGEESSSPQSLDCGNHLEGIDPEEFKHLFEQYILQSSNDTEESSASGPQWPRLSQILSENILALPQALSDGEFLNMTCSAWHSIKKIRSPVIIPVLKTEGPHVDNVYELINLALKLVVVNPYRQKEESASDISDDLIHQVATVCQSCKSSNELSYTTLRSKFYQAEPVPCSQTLFGGSGSVVEKHVAAALSEGTHEIQFGNKVTLDGVESDAMHFLACDEGNVLKFNIDLDSKLLSESEEAALPELFGQVSYMPPGNPFTADPSQHLQIPSVRVKSSLVWNQKAGTAEVTIKLKNRGLYGTYDLSLQLPQQEDKLPSKILFNSQVICGRPPVFLESHPYSLLDHATQWSDLLHINTVKINKLNVPVRHHLLSYDVRVAPWSAPGHAETISYLASSALLTGLQNAEKVQLPKTSPLKKAIKLTKVCDHDRMEGWGAQRYVYHPDLMDVTPCLVETLRDIPWVSNALSGGWRPPNAALMTVRATRKRFMVYNVNFVDHDESEATNLLHLMEHFRIQNGFPLILMGNFGGHDGIMRMDRALHQTGYWRNYFPITLTVRDDSTIWLPTVIDSANHPHIRAFNEPSIQTVDWENICLAIPSGNSTTANRCAPVAEYAKWYRQEIGGILADDRLPTPHERCAVDTNAHIPVGYTIEGGKTTAFSMVTYKVENPQLVTGDEIATLISTYDIVALQFAGDAKQYEWPLIDAIKEASPKSQYTVSDTATETVRLIRKDGGPAEIKCLSDTGNGQQVMGCLYEHASLPFIVGNIDASGLAAIDAFNRIYSKLCSHYALKTDLLCSEKPIAAFVMGSWRNLQLNHTMTWEEYQGKLGKLETEISQLFNRGNPKEATTTIVLPQERIAAHPVELLYQVASNTLGSMFSWLRNDRGSKRLWPYYTTDTGSIEDFMIHIQPQENAHFSAPLDLVRIETFAGSPLCSSGDSTSDLANNPIPTMCGRTSPACTIMGPITAVTFGLPPRAQCV
ncbi:hypothetical protein DFS34DRAFT_685206 [Phlyctochytrium arcticum]|nr:hypothetical protein DFS34DRAFT_685206 [Phlyctochytrium arcticum]